MRSEGVPWEKAYLDDTASDAASSTASNEVFSFKKMDNVTPVSSAGTATTPRTETTTYLVAESPDRPNISSQEAEGRSVITMTPTQQTLQQQLHNKHIELTKRLAQQQEDLKKSAENLLLNFGAK